MLVIVIEETDYSQAQVSAILLFTMVPMKRDKDTECTAEYIHALSVRFWPREMAFKLDSVQ